MKLDVKVILLDIEIDFNRLDSPWYQMNRFIFKYKKVDKIVRQLKPDIIHIQSAGATSLIMPIWSKTNKIIYVTHMLEAFNYKWAIKWLLILVWRFRARYRNISFVVTSNASASYTVAATNMQPEVIYNGVDSNNFLVRKHYASDVITLVNVARLDKDKNHDLIIDVADNLRKHGITFKLLLAGDGDLKEHLQQRVEELGLAMYVDFLRFVYDVPKLLSECDIYVHPCREAFGISIVEAMISGLPVVSINEGAVNELIDDGKEGFLVEKDVQKFSNAIMDLANDLDKRKCIGASARKKGLLYSVEAMVEGYKKIYNQ